MPEFRLYTPAGASMDLDMLISILEGKAEKAKSAHEAQQRVLKGSYWSDTRALQKATAEVAIQAGMEIGFSQSANLLRSVKDELVRKDAA